MGALYRFKLDEIIEDHGITTFFETGTGHGAGLKQAQQAGFKKIISVEINEHQCQLLLGVFGKDERTILINSNSILALETLLPALEETPILFWLDAHFPGADLGMARFDDVKEMCLRAPLKEELEVIFKHRTSNGINDVIICDDLNIYEDLLDGFDNSPLCHHVEGLGEQFKLTHNVIRCGYSDCGYLVLSPRNKPVVKIYLGE